MKAKDVVIGGTYYAKVSGKLCQVKVQGCRSAYNYGRPDKMVYDCINCSTGRTVTKSARQLRATAFDTASRKKPMRGPDPGPPVISPPVDILGDIRQDIAKVQELKYAAGHRISCPRCGNILDWKTTVLLSRGRGSAVLCLECFVQMLQNRIDTEPHFNATEWLEKIPKNNLTLAHNLHIVDGKVTVGACLLQDSLVCYM